MKYFQDKITEKEKEVKAQKTEESPEASEVRMRLGNESPRSSLKNLGTNQLLPETKKQR